MLTPTQTYCTTQFAGLAFTEWLLMSLSVWFTSHFGLVFLNFVKMDCSFLLHFLSSCAPNCFPFQYCDLLPVYFHFPYSYCLIAPCRTTYSNMELLQISLLALNQPQLHKNVHHAAVRRGYGSFWTAPPSSSRHHTDDQAAFGCLSPIGWIHSCLPQTVS